MSCRIKYTSETNIKIMWVKIAYKKKHRNKYLILIYMYY